MSGGNNDRVNSNVKEIQLTYASDNEFAGLNTILKETNIDTLLFRELMKFDENNRPMVDIAKSFEISKDKLKYF